MSVIFPARDVRERVAEEKAYCVFVLGGGWASERQISGVAIEKQDDLAKK